MNTNANRRNAFTLVELLVVVAIILVLAALLLPALASARNRAKTVKCNNNERQFAAGLGGYLNDHNEYYPWIYPECPMTNDCAAFGQVWRQSYGGGSCSAGPWWPALLPYIGINTTDANDTNLKNLIRCPSNPSSWTYPGAGGLVYCSYAMNGDIFPQTWRCGGASSCGSACANPPTGASPLSPMGWSRRVRGSDLNHASAAMFMGEEPVDGPVLLPTPQHNLFTQANPTRYGNGLPYAQFCYIEAYNVTNVFWGHPAWWSAPYMPGTTEYLAPAYNANVSFFHNLGMNVLFCDGHVELISKSTMITYACQFYDPTGAHNIGIQGQAGANTPGGIFWADGKMVPGLDSNWSQGGFWTGNQFPGAPYQN